MLGMAAGAGEEEVVVLPRALEAFDDERAGSDPMQCVPAKWPAPAQSISSYRPRCTWRPNPLAGSVLSSITACANTSCATDTAADIPLST